MLYGDELSYMGLIEDIHISVGDDVPINGVNCICRGLLTTIYNGVGVLKMWDTIKAERDQKFHLFVTMATLYMMQSTDVPKPKFQIEEESAQKENNGEVQNDDSGDEDGGRYFEKFQTGGPCVDMRYGYFSPFYNVQSFKATYVGFIYPFDNEEDWDKVEIGDEVLPPPLEIKSGRPRKQIIRDADKERPSKKRVCKLCHVAGYNKRTCQMREQGGTKGI
ncbi:hypothetical protein IFM89_032593 [Coptis chinensis]|uniref:Uncharacterized protein n=1 Tax=Coptis chinensis TaxID=261450 RepID=A0A835MAP7_9MAGN|nr:hypothetical protein IFM89_032593 [Coptis chinensis]